MIVLLSLKYGGWRTLSTLQFRDFPLIFVTRFFQNGCFYCIARCVIYNLVPLKEPLIKSRKVDGAPEGSALGVQAYPPCLKATKS